MTTSTIHTDGSGAQGQGQQQQNHQYQQQQQQPPLAPVQMGPPTYGSGLPPIGPNAAAAAAVGHAAAANHGGADGPPGLDMDLQIQLPVRRWPPTIASVTPGRSLTSSVLGRGPTPNIRTLYDIEPRPLGEGQYGAVYLCTEKRTGTRFACKTISRSTLISVEDVEDVRNEVSIMFALRGKPNVVRIEASFEDRSDVHIVMELCPGGELFDEINRRCELVDVPYSERDAARLCKGVIRAVHSCHSSGVIHRDLKPENFLLTSKSSDAIVKASDFGMSAFFKPGDGFSRVCGSCMYMAPEVMRLWENIDKAKYGPKVDVWAAGVICYILLCGSYPFLPSGTDRSEKAFRRTILSGRHRLFTESVWRKLSTKARDLVSQMLERDPNLRPSAEELLEHPWILEAPDEPLEREVVERFKKFLYVMRLKKVKKVALQSMVKTMDEEEIAAVRGELEQLDPNALGVVPVKQLPLALLKHGFTVPAEAVEAMIKEICLDGNVSFDYSDFFVALLQLAAIEKQENLFKAFSVYDQDLRGYITPEELQAACAKYRVNRTVVDEMMREVTRDAAGHVDYNEFVAMMRMEAGGVSRTSIERHIDNGSLKEMDTDGDMR